MVGININIACVLFLTKDLNVKIRILILICQKNVALMCFPSLHCCCRNLELGLLDQWEAASRGCSTNHVSAKESAAVVYCTQKSFCTKVMIGL